MKDIHTIAALIKTGGIDRLALADRLGRMDYDPALMVECGRVMEEVIALADD